MRHASALEEAMVLDLTLPEAQKGPWYFAVLCILCDCVCAVLSHVLYKHNTGLSVLKLQAEVLAAQG